MATAALLLLAPWKLKDADAQRITAYVCALQGTSWLDYDDEGGHHHHVEATWDPVAGDFRVTESGTSGFGSNYFLQGNHWIYGYPTQAYHQFWDERGMDEPEEHYSWWYDWEHKQVMWNKVQSQCGLSDM